MIKKISFRYYSALWKIDKINNKRYWIVIEDNKEFYRKFDTQKECIEYFKNLKIIGKMRIQYRDTKKFSRVIYTRHAWNQHGPELEALSKTEIIEPPKPKKTTTKKKAPTQKQPTKKTSKPKVEKSINKEKEKTPPVNEKILKQMDGTQTSIIDKLLVKEDNPKEEKVEDTNSLSITELVDLSEEKSIIKDEEINLRTQEINDILNATQEIALSQTIENDLAQPIETQEQEIVQPIETQEQNVVTEDLEDKDGAEKSKNEQNPTDTLSLDKLEKSNKKYFAIIVTSILIAFATITIFVLFLLWYI